MDRKSSFKVLEWVGLALWLGACNASHSPSPNPSAAASERRMLALTAECAAGSAAGGSWVCTAPSSTVACEDVADLQPIRVQAPAGTTCDNGDLRVTEDVQAGSSVRTFTVSGESGATLCRTTIDIVDEAPPVLQTHTIGLWPPNHKFHDIAVEDCVTAVDACDGKLRGEFIWASSDEPIDDIGDGHHSPDIGLSANHRTVCVRSERQGPKDGRVYKLGVRVVDRSGNAVEGECAVIVDHDKRGVVGADSGEKYRVTFANDSDAGFGVACTGAPDEPPPPPPPTDEDQPDGGPGDEPDPVDGGPGPT